MFTKIAPENKKILKWLLYSVAIFFIAVGIITGGLLAWEAKYEDKIYPGVGIADIDIGGVNKEIAGKIIMGKVDNISQEGIEFTHKDERINITPMISSFSPDVAYPVYSFDAEKAVNQAYQVGRSNSVWQNLGDKLKARFQGKTINIEYNLREDKIRQILKDNFEKYEDPAQDARLQVKEKEGEDIEFEITPEKAGEALDYNQALKEMGYKLQELNNNSPITLKLYKQQPRIHKENAHNIINKAKDTLSVTPLVLKYATSSQATTTQSSSEDSEERKEWIVNEKQLAEWLVLKKENNQIVIGVDEDRIESYLQENISSEIDQEPVDARFQIEDGKVSEFRDSSPGQKLNIPKTADKLTTAILRERDEKITLEIDTIKSEYTTNKVNDLGVDEIIGTGHSNFAGSSQNRIHNINVGADAVQGLLVEPGQEFSLNQALGEVNKENGYLPELVIKGNETKPEYGGGLCQIGTTMFRAALRSGLSITERQNHSYRVSYYEPPVGMDATIYMPHPDLRFVNDTDNHILIQSRIEGLDLYFDIWGTDDGRSVEISDPVVYNITPPPASQIIETTDLEPGERKCTEKAHNGATAHFDYQISYNNEEKDDRERRFYSHYKPWRERCLVGVEKEKEEKEEEEKKQKEEVPTTTEKQNTEEE